jgi:2,3-bisphosphoglycerate-independent phosphoglycerate mutase
MAHTNTLDGLAAESVLLRLRTVAPWLEAGSESAIPALLGWVPDRVVARGAVEAAAFGVRVEAGERAWRVDRRDRGDAGDTARLLDGRLSGHRVVHLAGHRMLAVGAPPLPALGDEVFVWPAGAIPPRVLDAGTVVIGARGAAVGIARLMGAHTVVPPGATGRLGSDLAGKAEAALAAIAGGARRVVVHVGGADEAAHGRDAAAKVAAIEAADGEVIAPLAAALRGFDRGVVSLRVCPDHGCDPVTGEHDGAPVPCLDWPASGAPATGAGARLTEEAVADLPVSELDALRWAVAA